MSATQVVTLVICCLVAVGTLVGVWGGLARAVRILGALKPGRQLAQSLASHPVPEAAFAHRWADLDTAFRKSEIVSAVWVPFAATVELTTRPDGSGAVASATGPEEWFQPHMLSAGAWSDSDVARLSGLLVSLGILGTFLGLTLGLAEADFGGIQAMGSADARTEALQAAMFGLLAGSSTAFLTSVAGLGGSLVLTATVRLVSERRVAAALAETAAALRAGIRVEPAELRLAQQLHQLLARPSPAEAFFPVAEKLIASVEAVQRDVQALHTTRGTLEAPPAARSNPTDDALVRTLTGLQVALRDLAEPRSEPDWSVALQSRLDAPPPPVTLAPESLSELQSAQDRLGELMDALAAAERRSIALSTRVDALVAALEAQSSTAVAPVALPPEVHATLQAIEGHLAASAESSATPGEALSTVEAERSVGQALAEGMAPTLSELSTLSQPFAAAAHRFDTATSRLDAAARSNHDAADTLRQASELLATRLSMLQQASAALRTGLAHHTDASTAMTSAAASLQALGPSLARASDQIRLGASSMELTADRLTALQRASGGPEVARLVPVLEALLAQLEKRG